MAYGTSRESSPKKEEREEKVRMADHRGLNGEKKKKKAIRQTLIWVYAVGELMQAIFSPEEH